MNILQYVIDKQENTLGSFYGEDRGMANPTFDMVVAAKVEVTGRELKEGSPESSRQSLADDETYTRLVRVSPWTGEIVKPIRMTALPPVYEVAND